MKVNRRWGYFTGTKKCPVPADPSNVTEDKGKKIEAWEYSDSIAGYLLSQCLPDITVMRLTSCDMTKEKWDMVTSEYQAKSSYAQADLQQSFLDMRCVKGGDVHEFLASLCYKKEVLAAAGVSVTEKEYQRIILHDIFSELVTFVSQILSLALILHNATSVNINTLINQINEEAKQLKS